MVPARSFTYSVSSCIILHYEFNTNGGHLDVSTMSKSKVNGIKTIGTLICVQIEHCAVKWKRLFLDISSIKGALYGNEKF